MLPKPPACDGCPFARSGRGFVPGCGPLNAKVAVLGQGPGKTEVGTGIPFHPEAPSGKLLTKWLELTGFPRETIWIDNAVRCLIVDPDSDEDVAPPHAIAECRRRHWEPQLRALPYLRSVILLGVPAAQTFLPWATGRTAGTFNFVEW